MSSAASGGLQGSSAKGEAMSDATVAQQSLKSISAISLFVEDVPATKAFYEDVFGVQTVFEDETSACVKFDGLFVNLVSVSSAGDLVGGVASPLAGVGRPPSSRGEDGDGGCS